MKKYFLLLITFFVFLNTKAQRATFENSSEDKIDYTISNNEKVITNEMIFWPPYDFDKNKKPLILVNGNKVECLTYFNKTEIKSIIVLQPKDALPKYKSKGRNGVVLVTLKESIKEPKIIIVTNKIYYKCKNENNIDDTTKSYYDKVKGENCTILKLIDTAKTQTLYIGFDNAISIKNLGAGWDRTIITMSGGSMSGSGNGRIIRVTKKGTVTIIIGRLIGGKQINTVIKMRVEDLPEWK